MLQFNHILKKSGQLVKPILTESLCLCCQQNTSKLLCQYCDQAIKKLIYPDNVCQSCGQLNIKANQCDLCLLNPPPWQQLVVAFHYDSLIKNLFQSFKFNHNFKIGSLLCQLFSQSISNKLHIDSDVILPVPIHRQRNISRGFNQAYILALALSKQANIPLNTNYIKRKKYTKAQTLLEGKARKANVNNAFSITSKIPYQRIIIIDDIITTGSTISSVCNTIAQSYASEIVVCVLAKPK
ncbi:hypothetical protein L3V82_03095 [Thiotrichales bacterium 19S3-7]|nr:hypothetical protein [Thiotrichales bacterium 19S3-7]MCF6801156.1 hypothetical protein [Thiotrichales bacterium 19S3-11]